ncbi:c2h2 transcription factor [Stylonychia lemnae]|uniref:C2h2 transcription factor n=1 Tax=Stylonychia lemnae TaxID=5949 RepID=A0A078AN19_STYLE|nr:c2h2 transcription factor [Stylonychia lemnae]|eukprot:CDW82293.1 c2h2 transcription factor [Stylonychia lemnae]
MLQNTETIKSQKDDFWKQVTFSSDNYDKQIKKKGFTVLQCTFENCHKTFNSQSSLSRHRNVHLGIQPYACPYSNCFSKFSQRTSLRHHIRTHTGERPYVCQHCGWAFATNGNRIDHERRHLKIKPYSCEQCGKCFYRPHQLKSHQSKCSDLQVDFEPNDNEEMSETLNFDFRVYNNYPNDFSCIYQQQRIQEDFYENSNIKKPVQNEQQKIGQVVVHPTTHTHDTQIQQELNQLKSSFLEQKKQQNFLFQEQYKSTDLITQNPNFSNNLNMHL